MNAAQLQAFRDIADAMQTKPADWQWLGPHMSQRMFGITQERAEAYARRHGGKAAPMAPAAPEAPLRMICAWCPDFDPKAPENASATHGMCPSCAAKF